MKVKPSALTAVALCLGLLATGALALAVSTDHWLHTWEPMEDTVTREYTRNLSREMGTNRTHNDTETFRFPIVVGRSGLWRMCIVSEGSPTSCNSIDYIRQDWARIKEEDTTWSILRGTRKGSLTIVVSLLLLFVAFGLATLGNTKRDARTIAGAVVYVFAALCLGVGVILYISAVNDEVWHRKKPKTPEDPVFEYRYGWAFFFAGSAFVSSLLASLTNVTLYLARYPTNEEMFQAIPGLEGKQARDTSKDSFQDDMATSMTVTSQNQTTIL